jgi:ribosome-binding ATPase YchF (GTP1/OBG family)
MPEGAPSTENIKSRKEVFKLLYRKIGGFADIDGKLPEKYLKGKHNTSVALNLLAEFVDDNQPLPPDWDTTTISAETPFFFFRMDNGVLVANQREYYFSSPAAFVAALQKFYKLDHLTIAEMQAELEAAKAAEKAKEKAEMEAIRSGEWVKNRMPESLEPRTPESLRVTPRRPSAFRPNG